MNKALKNFQVVLNYDTFFQEERWQRQKETKESENTPKQEFDFFIKTTVCKVFAEVFREVFFFLVKIFGSNQGQIDKRHHFSFR